MKRTKRVLALLLTMMMVMGMATMVSADEETYTISEATGSAVEYTVYQLLTGDVDSTDKILSNIEAGKNLLSSVTAETFASTISEKSDAEATQYAYSCVDFGSDAYGKLDSSNNYTLTEVPSGYYLLIADDGSVYVLQVIGENVTITPKTSGSTTGSKAIVNYDGDQGESEDGAAYAIGDTVNFSLTATLPANFSAYTTYQLTFTDVMDAGLTYDEITSIKIGSTEYIVYDDGENGYGIYLKTDEDHSSSIGSVTVTEDSDGITTIVVSFTNLVGVTGAANDAEVIVYYSAILNSSATTGSTANENKVTIKYSNNPNNTESTGSIEDIVYVYTFKLTVSKTDGEEALTGAGFTLYIYDEDKGEWTLVDVINSSNYDGGTSSFVFSGLDEGFYKLVETTTPDGYNTADDIYFTIDASYDESGELESVTIYDEDSTSTKSDEVSADPDFAISTTVVNEKGTTLPETGGMGTTILYIAGIALVLFAGVMLVTRRRMGREG